jgi:hypothetical protein
VWFPFTTPMSNQTKKQPLKIIIAGPPASGKGTQVCCGAGRQFWGAAQQCRRIAWRPERTQRLRC